DDEAVAQFPRAGQGAGVAGVHEVEAASGGDDGASRRTHLAGGIGGGGGVGGQGDERGIEAGHPARAEEFSCLNDGAEGRGGKVLPFAQRLGGGGGKAVSCPAGVDLLAGGSGREVQGHFGGAGEHHASFGGRHRYCFAAPLPAQQVPGGE